MQNDKPLFVIITRNHNRYLLTCEFIESIEKISYKNKKIIIVDDGSTDDSGTRIKKEYKERVEVIFTKKYVEYCKGLNFGIRYAIQNFNPDFFFLINNDTKNFSENYFDVALNSFIENPKIGKFGSSVYDYEGGKRGGGNLMNKLGVDLVTPTEGYIIPRAVFEKIGIFDEALVRYFEDLDLIKRMHDNDYVTFADKSISFDHLGGGTTKNMPFVRNYYRVRNLLWFIKRYGKELTFRKRIILFKSYFGTHYYNFISPLKKLKLIMSIKVLASIIWGLLIGVFTSWKPKTNINE
jgi:GT2 family glycosyltransferase